MNDKTVPQGSTLIAARIFDTPLLIQQDKLQQILQVLGPRLDFDLQTPPPDLQIRTKEQSEAELEKIVMQAGTGAQFNRDGGYFEVGSAAIIPVFGTLVQRSSWMNAMSGMTSYAGIEQKFSHALDNERVDEIIMELDSPGGEVSGCFALADRIYEARGVKPITAIANEYAASAAYLIASAADTLILTKTSSLGSIGVVAAHFDRSKELDKRGVAVTFIFAGDKKVDGNPFEPLSDRAQSEWQENIDTLYSMFTETVARNRNMSEKQVRSTQAGMFMGRKAVDAGLADRVNTFANEVHNLSIRRGSTTRLTATQEETSMKTFNQEQLDEAVTTARAEGETAGADAASAEHESALAAAVAEACTGERTRIQAITTSEHAKGREGFATYLAFETELASDQALTTLEAAPKNQTKSQLAAAMEALGSPEIPSQEGDDAPKPKAIVDTQQIYGNLNKGYNENLNS